MKMNKHRYLIIFFLHICLLQFPVHALWENIRFSHLSIEDGLAQNSPLCMVQDRVGFIWIGTQGGLNRYDGYTFKLFSRVADNPNSLSASFINSFCEDSATGHFFIGTEEGFNEFDPETQRFTRFYHEPDNPNSVSNNRIISVCTDNRGSIWIGTETGLNRFSIQEKTFSRYTTVVTETSDSLSHTVIKNVFVDKAGMVWLCTAGNGLIMHDPVKGSFRQYIHSPGDRNSISSNYILSLAEGRNGILWIGTYGAGLNRFERSTGTFTAYTLNANHTPEKSENIVNTILEDKEGYLWLGKENDGLVVFNPENEEAFFYKNDPTIPYSLGGNKVISTFQDRSGTIWIGSFTAGLSVHTQEKKHFELYRQDPYDANSLSDNNVWSIHEDRKGIVWIGTESGGLNRFDRKNKRWKHFMYNPDNPDGIDNNRISAIGESSDGALWIGTFGGGLAKYDPVNGRFRFHRLGKDDPLNPDENRVLAICTDRKGRMWVGTKGGGLKCFDPQTGKITHYMHDPKDSGSLNNNRVYSVLEDKDGVLWAGMFSGGLDRYDRDRGRFTHFMSDSANPHSISSNLVVNILEDKNGVMWIATYGGGINKFDRSTGRFRRFTEKDGLGNNDVYAILEDRNDNLWMSTNRGISKFNKKKETFECYTVENGLQSNEFNSNAFFQNKEGEMFFGGISGFNIFNPDSVSAKVLTAPVVITGFELFNKPVGVGKKILGKVILDKSITFTRKIYLTRKHTVFSIQYAALNYASQNRVYYAYIMEGLEKEWNHVGNRRFVTFSTLPPGKYTFKVKASNDNRTWSRESNDLEIIILPPFWKTWWFITLCAVIISVIASAAYRYRVNLLQKRKEEEEHLKVITDVGQVLEHGSATIYRRRLDFDLYDYMGNGIRDITGYSADEFTPSLWYKIIITEEIIGEYSGLSVGEAYKRMRDGSIDSFVSDFNFRAKSGDIRWARDITTAIRDESGKCYAYLGIIFDITDRKLAEQDLAAKGKSIQQTLLEHTPDPIVIFDRETHTFLDCNKAALYVYGYTKDEIRSMTPYDLHPPEDYEKVEKNIDVKNFDTPNEYTHITKDGRKMDVEIVSDETVYMGKPAWISIVRNITERKRVERELARANKDMETDLNMAREVQMALLSQNYPKNFPRNVPPDKSVLQFSHRYIPTSELAGDFFEIIPVSDHEIGILIYDVMGHGVRASLLTAYLHGLVEELIPLAGEPVAFMKRLNLGLNAVVTQFYAEMFTTAFYLVANIKTGRMQYTNAGHPYPYLIQGNGNAVRHLPGSENKPQPALGLISDHNYTASECAMNSDDTVLFFTDGIYEVENESKQLFGQERLIKTIENQQHKIPEKMLDGILDEIKEYAGTSEFIDDVCMVTMHIKRASL